MPLRTPALTALLVLAASTAPAAEAYRFRNPFHPAQCDRAIAAGSSWLRRENPERARRVLAEGYLCRALRDDPWALHESIRLFRRIVRDDPADFFATLHLADALRRSYPLSEEAHAMLRRTRRMLAGGADVGAALPDLRAYLDEALAAMTGQRGRVLPELERLRGALRAAERGEARPDGVTRIADGGSRRSDDSSGVSASDLRAFLSQVVLTGPAGTDEALATLQARGPALLGPVETALGRAEILRGRENPRATIERYRKVEASACAGGRLEESCRLARWRLDQLRALAPTEVSLLRAGEERREHESSTSQREEVRR
jgi:hypothetical protein